MGPIGGAGGPDVPWSETHRPKHLGQVIGNTDQVRKLAEWLRDWDDVVLHGKTKEVQSEKGKEWQKFKQVPDNINARAALVSGPPGIGKTTTATLVARCNRKYKLMEFNASDARSKKVVDTMSKSLAGNHTLSFGANGKSAIERAVIIMDECDGMSGGGDSGGMNALINMIKVTKSPIICICNDRGDSGVRDLSAHCLDLKFKRPDSTAIAKRIRGILEGQGKKVDLMALESTSEACGHDIRQVINQIQFFGVMAAHSKGSQKDTQVMLSPFDACARLLSRTKAEERVSLDKKFDMFYIDADLMPAMIQENYLRGFEKPRPGENDESMLRSAANAAELIAVADSMSGNWELMNSQAAIGTLYPAFLAAGDGAPRPSFPAMLQKRSSIAKAARMVQEVHARMQAVTTCSARSMVTTAYHELLHRRLLQPLTFGDTKGCAALLTGCGLNREFFTEQAPTFRVPLGLEDTYKKIEGRHKAQLLSDISILQSAPAPTKRKRQDGGGNADDRGDDADNGTPDVAGDDTGGMFKKKKTTRKSVADTGKTEKSGAGAKSKAPKCSLANWKPAKAGADGEGNGADSEEGPSKKKAGLILKFIEGHTNAVRRKVQLAELLAPWRNF
mmetsp:Transcript_120704/g.341330  ORF Transcript_120704/g.341330 Transcript_120704/m.341330 type:complete len:617 (+) Transcript_120704:109-1959(+)|eukprot:CAMPEP_0117500190 /NCGR_PEP_ID=MMETSP0784-20121206/22648_1 /TAXON_ID=39447 /ORGANISM="" /LENGTH=616 /DNA_ID=CAMNT_0005295391 /DNA_START=109 /DNA_END=1959 /DNA_ORIENTATION=+